MAALRASKVREVHVIGRRGPAQAKFTTKELRELGELPGVHVSAPTRPRWTWRAASTAPASRPRSPRRPPGARQPGRHGGLGRRRRPAPAERPGASCGCASGCARWRSKHHHPERWLALRLERTRISESGQFEGTGEFETIDAQMVLRSVGYQSVPLPGVPFDTRSCTVPNASGRVLSEAGEPLPGEYVAGWLKRGPTGVIGTNKADAAETVQALLADLAGGPDVGEGTLPRPGLLRRPDEDPDDPRRPRRARAAPRCSRPAAWRRSPTPTGCASPPRKRSSRPPSAAATG